MQDDCYKSLAFMDNEVARPIAPPRRKKTAKLQAALANSESLVKTQLTPTIVASSSADLQKHNVPRSPLVRSAPPSPRPLSKPSKTVASSSVKLKPVRPERPKRSISKEPPSSGQIAKTSVNSPSLQAAYAQKRRSSINRGSSWKTKVDKDNPDDSESPPDIVCTIINSRVKALERKSSSEDYQTMNPLTSASSCKPRSCSFNEQGGKSAPLPPEMSSKPSSVDNSPTLASRFWGKKDKPVRPALVKHVQPVAPSKDQSKSSKNSRVKPVRPAPPIPATIDERIYAEVSDLTFPRSRARAELPVTSTLQSSGGDYTYVDPGKMWYPYPPRNQKTERENGKANEHHKSASLPRNGENCF